MTTGSTTRVEAAMSRLYATSCSLVKNARPIASGYLSCSWRYSSGSRNSFQAATAAKIGDDRDGWPGQRQDDPPEDLELVRAIDLRGVGEVA